MRFDELDNTLYEDIGNIPPLTDLIIMAVVAQTTVPVIKAAFKAAIATGKGLLKLKRIADKAGVKLDRAVMGEAINKDEYAAQLKAKAEDKFMKAALAALDRLVKSDPRGQTVGGYAFDIARAFQGINGRELERLYTATNESVITEKELSSREQNALMVYQAFKNAGFTDAQARGLTAEVNRENAFQDKWLYGTHSDPANSKTNAGMISWQGPRKAALMQWMGERGLLDDNGRMIPGQATLDAQAAFLRQEMETNSHGGSAAQDAAIKAWMENPNPSEQDSQNIIGGKFIRWALNNPKYRKNGLANLKNGYATLDAALTKSGGAATTQPNTQVAKNVTAPPTTSLRPQARPEANPPEVGDVQIALDEPTVDTTPPVVPSKIDPTIDPEQLASLPDMPAADIKPAAANTTRVADVPDMTDMPVNPAVDVEPTVSEPARVADLPDMPAVPDMPSMPDIDTQPSTSKTVKVADLPTDIKTKFNKIPGTPIKSINDIINAPANRRVSSTPISKINNIIRGRA